MKTLVTVEYCDYKKLIANYLECQAFKIYSPNAALDSNYYEKARQDFYETYPDEVEEYIFDMGIEIEDLDFEDMAQIMINSKEENEYINKIF